MKNSHQNMNHEHNKKIISMGMHMQDNMTCEWHQQMMSMHDRMANMYQEMGQQSIVDINRRLSEGYAT